MTPGLTADLLPSVAVLEELASDVLLEPVGMNLGAVIGAFPLESVEIVPFVKPFPSPFPPDLLATPVVEDLFEAEGFNKIFSPTLVPLAKLVDFRSLFPVDVDERLKEEALFVAGLSSVAFVSVI
jgi:hypothetical protein